MTALLSNSGEVFCCGNQRKAKDSSKAQPTA